MKKEKKIGIGNKCSRYRNVELWENYLGKTKKLKLRSRKRLYITEQI